MTLVNGHPRGRLLKKFTDLGPYIREEQCQDSRFFFDCLAVCVNAKSAPEKREFWGWWLELEAQDNQLIYNYHIGLFDKNGDWKVALSSNQEVDEKVEQTLQAFFKRLKQLLVTLEIELVPSEQLSEKARALTA